MTAETAMQALEILKASYPGEAYKLSGDGARRTAGIMEAMFRRTDDAVFLNAVGKCCENCEKLPSMAIIRKAVKEIQNAVPDFVSLPAPVNVIGIDKIKAIKEKARAEAVKRAKQRDKKQIDPNDTDYYSYIPSTLVRFAKNKFPDISLEQIAAYNDEFQYNMDCRGQLDGHPLVMRIDKYTGNICNVVLFTEAELERKKI